MDKRYYLRRQRIIAYQLAMLICLAAECTATYSLSKYEDQQEHIEKRYAPALVHNNNLLDFQISLIVFCVLVACVFGADFFFLAAYKLHKWPRWYRNSMIAASCVISAGVFAVAVGSTIVVARQSATITGVANEVAQAAAAYYYRPPLEYKRWAVNIAFVVLIWVGWPFVVISTYLMYKAATYDFIHGPAPREDGSFPKSQESLVGTSPQPNTPAEMGELGGTKQSDPAIV